MAKTEGQYLRISDIVKPQQVARPNFNTEQVVNKEMAITDWHFEVSEKNGTDYAVIEAVIMTTRQEIEITSFDKAIIAQLGSIPNDTPKPILAKVVKFGRYFALE